VNGELKDVAGNGSCPARHEAPNMPGRTEEIYAYQQKKKIADLLDNICTEDFQNTKQDF
jgi:hypothetical protein